MGCTAPGVPWFCLQVVKAQNVKNVPKLLCAHALLIQRKRGSAALKALRPFPGQVAKMASERINSYALLHRTRACREKSLKCDSMCVKMSLLSTISLFIVLQLFFNAINVSGRQSVLLHHLAPEGTAPPCLRRYLVSRPIDIGQAARSVDRIAAGPSRQASSPPISRCPSANL